jgi:hypothetical protein
MTGLSGGGAGSGATGEQDHPDPGKTKNTRIIARDIEKIRSERIDGTS